MLALELLLSISLQTDQNNHLLRRVDLVSTLVTTVAGNISGIVGTNNFGSADGVGTAASFNIPWGVVVDVAGATTIVVSMIKLDGMYMCE